MRSQPRAPRRALALTVTTAAALGVALTTGFAAAPVSAPHAAGVLTTSPAAAVVSVSSSAAEALATSTADAQAALDSGREAMDAAASASADIAASGLDLGVDTTLDTTALGEAVDRLDEANFVPALLFPERAEDVVVHARAVAARAADLRAALDAARAQKAADEAAAAAAAEAQRQAEAAALALAQANTPDGARATARTLAAERYGWGEDQFSCLSSLWQKESNWNFQAYNASSGATGIPQALPGSKMASAGADWQTNAATQIAWGLDYIDRAYGTPCAAWGHSQSTNWY